MRFILLALAAAALGVPPGVAAPPGVGYEEHVKPVLRKRCQVCHNPEELRGGLDVSSYATLLAGGSSGKSLVAGKADQSPLYLLTAHLEGPHMPPAPTPKIAEKELDVIRKWIEGGLAEKAADAKPVAEKLPEPTPPPAPAKGRDPVTALAASPKAPLVAASGPKQVLLFDAATLKPLEPLPFPAGDVLTLRFSRDGKVLLAGGGSPGENGVVIGFNVETKKKLFEVGDEEDAVLAADLSPDGSRVALGGPGKELKVFATKDGALLWTAKRHTDWVTCVEFSPEGLLVASGDRNGGLFVWEAAAGKEFAVLRGHQGPVTGVSWRADSNGFASSCEDGVVRLWDMHTAEMVKSWPAHTAALGLHMHADGRLVTCGRDKLVKVWDRDGKELKSYEPASDQVLKVAFSHDGGRVVAGLQTGELRGWATPAAPVAVKPPPAVNLNAEQLVNEANAARQFDEAVKAVEAARATLADRQALLKSAQDTAERVKTTGRASAAARELVLALEDEVKEAEQQLTERLQTAVKCREALEAALKPSR